MIRSKYFFVFLDVKKVKYKSKVVQTFKNFILFINKIGIIKTGFLIL